MVEMPLTLKIVFYNDTKAEFRSLNGKAKTQEGISSRGNVIRIYILRLS